LSESPYTKRPRHAVGVIEALTAPQHVARPAAGTGHLKIRVSDMGNSLANSSRGEGAHRDVFGFYRVLAV
jgi:hypothetical protein